MEDILLDERPTCNSEAASIRWMILVLGNNDRRRYGFNEWAKSIRRDLISTGEWVERVIGKGQIEIRHRSMSMN